MALRIFPALAAVAALSGCASTPIFEGGRAWNEGWREGKVEQVGAASELGYRQSYDCRYREGGAGRDAPGRFAIVGVQTLGGHRHHVAPVGPGREIEVGAPVLTNWRSCEPPVARGGR